MVYSLQGLKIVDLTQGISGPYCTMQLGDLGAEVIKIEPVEGDYSRQLGPPFVGGESALFLSVNRNKKSLALNYETEPAREIVKKLAKDADVFLQDMNPSQAEHLGLGYEVLARTNLRLIYCSITPFGSQGPMASYPGSELVAQGMSGLWRYLGDWGEAPLRIGQDFATTTTGIFAFHGIMAALFHRERTGKGQKVETSYLGTLSAFKNIVYAAQSDPPEWTGFHLPAPFWLGDHGYSTKDGAVYLRFGGRLSDNRRGTAPGGGEAERWEAFMKEIGLGDYLSDPRFRGWTLASLGFASIPAEQHAIFDRAFQRYTTQELTTIAQKYGGELLPFNDYDALFKHPQTQAMEIVKEVEHHTAGSVKYIAPPWSFEKCEVVSPSPPPLLGQHTKEILEDLGYSQGEISRLKDEKTVAF